MTTLSGFMEQTQYHLCRAQSWKFAHIVIGNETCDLDSVVSTLCLALHYSTSIYQGQVVIPLMNLNSDEFNSHTVCVYVLRKFNIPVNLLIFKNEIDLKEISKNITISVTLVDHHVLDNHFKFLESKVTTVFDHRSMDHSKCSWNPDVDIHLREVGSCATLISLTIFRGNIQCICTPAMLLYSAIIFDTLALNEDAHLATEIDDIVAGKIEDALKITLSRKKYFEELWKAHSDYSKLSTYELLCKDLKFIEFIVIPALPILIEEFIKFPDAMPALKLLCTERNVKLAVLMGLQTNTSPIKRDIALFYMNDEIIVHVVRHHLVNINRHIELDMVHNENPNFLYYRQLNTEYTRREIFPILQKCVNYFIELEKTEEAMRMTKKHNKKRK